MKAFLVPFVHQWSPPVLFIRKSGCACAPVPFEYSNKKHRICLFTWTLLRFEAKFQENTESPRFAFVSYFLLNKNSEWVQHCRTKEQNLTAFETRVYFSRAFVEILNRIKLLSELKALNSWYNTLSYGLFAVTMGLCVALENRVLLQQ